jgi:hypothetical protein
MARKAKAPSKLNVRLDAELRRRLEEEAARKGTSLQTEITTRLQASLGLDDRQLKLVETMQGAIETMQRGMQDQVELVDTVQGALQGIQDLMRGATQSQFKLVDTVRDTMQRTMRVWDVLLQRMTTEEKQAVVAVIKEVMPDDGTDTRRTRTPVDSSKGR